MFSRQLELGSILISILLLFEQPAKRAERSKNGKK